jgi:hypothetical protein
MLVTTKVKIAAGLATGALALGAAGAYAAANNTITVAKPQAFTVNGPTGTTPLSLISVSGKTTTLTLPTSFKSQGECVSTFARNKDLALAPTTTSSGPLKLSKNYHGKLMSAMAAWCAKAAASTTSTTDTQTTDSADTQQSAAPTTDSTDATDSSDQPSANGLSHGHGQGHGRGHSND